MKSFTDLECIVGYNASIGRRLVDLITIHFISPMLGDAAFKVKPIAPLNLILSNDTRWNTACNISERFLEFAPILISERK